MSGTLRFLLGIGVGALVIWVARSGKPGSSSRRQGVNRRPDTPVLDIVDEASVESFPASDAPAY